MNDFGGLKNGELTRDQKIAAYRAFLRGWKKALVVPKTSWDGMNPVERISSIQEAVRAEIMALPEPKSLGQRIKDYFFAKSHVKKT